MVDFDAVPDLQLAFHGESVTPLVSKDVKDAPFEHGESWISWRNNVSVLSPLSSVTAWRLSCGYLARFWQPVERPVVRGSEGTDRL